MTGHETEMAATKSPAYTEFEKDNYQRLSEGAENVVIDKKNSHNESADRNYLQSHDTMFKATNDDSNSMVSSKDEVEFRKELAVLDADIERLQKSLKYMKYN